MPSGFVTSSLNGTVVNGNNLNFGTLTPGNVGEMNAAGKIPIATGVAYPGVQVVCNTLTAGPGVTITNGAGSITIGLTGGGIGIDSIGVQATTAPGVSPVVPTGAGLVSINGASVAASAVPVQSRSIAVNSLQIEVQRADDFGVSSAANAGLASFNNAHFSVDANGYVSELNGLPATKFTVDASTAPGTNPVVPTAAGVVTFTGAQAAAGTIPTAIRSDSLAANTVTIEVQRSSAQAVSSVAQNGVCHFNSGQFTVDAFGFVSAISGTAPWLDVAVPTAMVNHTGYFVTAAVAVTLPAGVANGDMIEVVDAFGGGVVVTASGANLIRIGNVVSSAGGTATTTQLGDSARFVFRLVTQTWYAVPGVEGNWVLA